MNEKVKDGGPAFPSQTDTFRADDGRAVTRSAESGMTLRDYFAAKALVSGIVNGPFENDQGDEEPYHDYRARMAYKLADAMLRTRESST